MTLSDEAVERAARAVHGVLSRANALAYLDMPEDTATVAARAALEASSRTYPAARKPAAISDKEVEELRALLGKATPGPWRVQPVALGINPWITCSNGTKADGNYVRGGCILNMVAHDEREHDAALIVWLRNHAANILEASGLVDQSERIKELEDRLATAREVICRSAYFVEALADNDPDEPIADNGMTVLGKLQYDAPALALSLRATLDAIKEKNGA